MYSRRFKAFFRDFHRLKPSFQSYPSISKDSSRVFSDLRRVFRDSSVGSNLIP